MKKLLLILVVLITTYTSCTKTDSPKTGAQLTQHQLDSIALLADTMYIRNEVFDTSKTTIIDSKKVYMYHCDMYYPASVIGVVSPSVIQGAVFEYKKQSETNYSVKTIFRVYDINNAIGKVSVEVGVDTFGFQYHWHFYNGNNHLFTLDRKFKL